MGIVIVTLTFLLLMHAVPLLFVGFMAATAAEPQPQPTLNLPCEVVEVYDGDTLTVRVSVDVRVRLLDCWAHEVRTKNAEAKALGLASRDHLRSIATPGTEGTLEVPLGGVTRLDDIFTMGRVLGKVWHDDVELGEVQVATGHAWTTKAELEEARREREE